MDKELADWLKKRMTQIDERGTLFEHDFNREADQW